MESRFNYFDNPIRFKVFQLAGVVLKLLGFIGVGTYLSQFILSEFIGIDFVNLEIDIFEMEGEIEQRTTLLLMQALNAIFVYLVLPLIYVFFFQRDLTQVFLIKKERLGSFILMSFFIFIAALPFITQLIEFNRQLQIPERLSDLQENLLRMEKRVQQVSDVIVLYDYWYEVIPILLVIGVLAAIGEEFLFRGVIQNEIHGIFGNLHVAIWISAILFSFVHFQFQGFLPRMFLGGLLGYLYYWSGSLLVPIFIHFVNNTLTFFLINYAKRQDEAPFQISDSLGITLLSTFIFLILLLAYYQLYLKIKKMSY